MVDWPISKSGVPNPFRSPHGETVFELVGRSPAAGSTASHSLAYIVLSPAKSSLPHTHQVIEETYYILHGVAEMVLGQRRFALHPDQAVLIKPGQMHQIFNIGVEDLEFLAICSPAWYPEDSIY